MNVETSGMIKVSIESPYAGDVEANVLYAKACLKDSLKKGEAPFASHLLYTLVLDDQVPEERALGMQAGFAYLMGAHLIAVYTDLGVSPGMAQAILMAKGNIPVKYRQLTSLRQTGRTFTMINTAKRTAATLLGSGEGYVVVVMANQHEVDRIRLASGLNNPPNSVGIKVVAPTTQYMQELSGLKIARLYVDHDAWSKEPMTTYNFVEVLKGRIR